MYLVLPRSDLGQFTARFGLIAYIMLKRAGPLVSDKPTHAVMTTVDI